MTSFRDLAYQGIGIINKVNQHHQLPLCALEYMNLKEKNAVYAVKFSTDRKEHIDTLKEIEMALDPSSQLLVETDDPFVEKNIQQEFKYSTKVKVNTNMAYDLPAGNPIFYERSDTAMDSRTGSKLVYDEHIMNAVNRMSSKFKQVGPFITDTTWFQGGAKQGKFREWLFSKKFGLKTIVMLPSADFDVDADKTELCMFIGEKGYQGDITVINYSTKEQFVCDFRALGYVIKNKELATLLPAIQTKSKYDWKRSKIHLKLDPKNGDILEGPPEVSPVNKADRVKVLKKLLLNQKPQYYFTTKKHIKDQTDINAWRFVTGYNSGTAHDKFYQIAKGVIVPPGIAVPGDMWFTYIVLPDKKSARQHMKHLMSVEVQQILKLTRTGKSLHTPQTIWIPYATEFHGFTDDQKSIITNL
jgi:hypothetical protein